MQKHTHFTELCVLQAATTNFSCVTHNGEKYFWTQSIKLLYPSSYRYIQLLGEFFSAFSDPLLLLNIWYFFKIALPEKLKKTYYKSMEILGTRNQALRAWF